MQRLCLTLWLLLPLLTSGCVTHKLWTESKLDEWDEPAASPNLHLFRDDNRDDFLVVYDEYSDRHYTTKARAFFLNQNQKPLRQHRRPDFANINCSHRLKPMPVSSPDADQSTRPVFWVTTTNGGNFAIYHGSRDLGSYSLPFYNDGDGRMERIAWTPLTVTADLTIIGGVVVIICWDGLAQSNYSAGVH